MLVGVCCLFSLGTLSLLNVRKVLWSSLPSSSPSVPLPPLFPRALRVPLHLPWPFSDKMNVVVLLLLLTMSMMRMSMVIMLLLLELLSNVNMSLKVNVNVAHTNYSARTRRQQRTYARHTLSTSTKTHHEQLSWIHHLNHLKHLTLVAHTLHVCGCAIGTPTHWQSQTESAVAAAHRASVVFGASSVSLLSCATCRSLAMTTLAK